MLSQGDLAAIPIVDAFVTGVAPWQSMAAGDEVTVGVQVVAVMFAWGFWRLAQAVRERSSSGNPNSVWAVSAGRVTTSSASEASQSES